MNLKTYLAWWWMAATLACCLALYAANPNDHSILPALLGVLVASFFLYWALRLAVTVGKNKSATKRIKGR